MSATTATLAIVLGDGSTPPKEFRLFVSGWNETENGDFLFDADAAKATMAAYKAWGVDLAIDLEHQMLASEIAPDPTAKDARGWCQLELRPDGSLWAVNVSWTADGAARLTEKRQRYISPAFSVDPETSRVVAIINVAITAIPATHDTPALMAARKALPKDHRRLSNGLAFGDIQTALGAALALLFPSEDSCSPGGPWVQDVFDATFVYQQNGELFEAPYTFDGSAATIGTPVQVRRTYVPVAAAPAPTAAPVDPTAPAPAAAPAAQTPAPPVANKKKSSLPAVRRLAATPVGENKMTIEEFLKVIKALGLDPSMTLEAAMAKIQGGASAEEAPPSSASGGAPDSSAAGGSSGTNGATAPAASADDDKKDKPEAVAASISRFLRLTGAKSFVDAVAVAETYRESHLELETERQKLAKERDTLESAERRRGCVELVTLGGHAPATVWADDKSTAPKKYLAAMPIEDFRDYVADALKSKGGGKTVTNKITPPASGTADVSGLTPEQARICAETKCDPTVFLALQNQRDVKTGGN